MSADDRRPVALVIAAFPWEAAARVALELAQVGFTVDVAAPAASAASHVRAVRHHYAVRIGRRPARLVAAMTASDADLVVPCDDRARQALTEVHASADPATGLGARLRGVVERSVGSSDHYQEIYSRARLMELATDEGIRAPATARVASAEDLAGWLASGPLPAVLKTDGSWGGRGVVIASRPAEAWAAWSRFQRPPSLLRALKRWTIDGDAAWMRMWLGRQAPDVAVQEHVVGRPANIAAVCRDGKLLGAVGVEVLSSRGPLGPSTVVQVVERDDMVEAAQFVARRFRLSGLFGLDFIIDEASGHAVLLELNPRATPTCHLVVEQGADLLGLLMESLDPGCAVTERSRVPADQPIALFPQLMRWEPDSEFLLTGHHDLPRGEPAFVAAVLTAGANVVRRTPPPLLS